MVVVGGSPWDWRWEYSMLPQQLEGQQVGGGGGHLAVLLWGHASAAAGGTLPEPGSCVGCVGGISSDGADPPNPQPPPASPHPTFCLGGISWS